jgi:hypothetical protein
LFLDAETEFLQRNPEIFLTTSLRGRSYAGVVKNHGELQVDPIDLAGDTFAGEIELVVPFTDPPTTRAVLERARVMTAGLNARITLVAIHSLPYPSPFTCPTATHAFLVDQLLELANGCPMPVVSQVVLARSREDGFRHALPAESTVLVGTRKHVWRTAEERLARMLAADGHKVILLHID